MKAKRSCLGVIFKIVFFVPLSGAWAYGCLGIYFSGPDPDWLKITLAILFGGLLPVAFIYTRTFFKGLLFCLFFFGIFLAWWQTLQPTNNKNWAVDVAQISHGDIQNDKLTMYNVRNFAYTTETEFEQRWETREYNLDKLQGMDIFLSYWASEHIAHTIMSWAFSDGQHLAISIETRKDKTQKYSAVKGFFKQFELSYIAADEKDIIELRTNYRKERVYVYRLLGTKERARALLEQYIKEMNSLLDKPLFYNALTHNCTTTIHLNANAINPGGSLPLDWRLIASGHVDEMLYDHGVVRQDVSFAALRRLNRIDLKMQKYQGSDYSGTLRKIMQ
jgi:hypothetical protein